MEIIKKDEYSFYSYTGSEFYKGYELRFYDSDPYDKVKVVKDGEIVFSHMWTRDECEEEAKKFVDSLFEENGN